MADISKGAANDRGKKIIKISRAQDKSALPKLLKQLSVETSTQNKRHIVRALGKLKDKSVVPLLEKMLQSDTGEILGDISRALADIGSTASTDKISVLGNHELVWVKESVTYALRKLGGKINVA